MKKLTLLLCLFSLFLISCYKEHEGVMIRVVNQTDKRLTDVSVFSSKYDGITDVEKKYGSVSPGSATGYQSHQRAINFPLFKLTIEGYGMVESREARCGVGLADLADGKYTLMIFGDNYGFSLRQD